MENDQVKFTVDMPKSKRCQSDISFNQAADLESYVDIAEIKGGKNNELA